MMAHLPQRCWLVLLVLNDFQGVCEVCPLLTVHFFLGIPNDVVERAFPLLKPNLFTNIPDFNSNFLTNIKMRVSSSSGAMMM